MALSITSYINQLVAGQPRKPGPIHDALQAIQNWAAAKFTSSDIHASAGILVTQTELSTGTATPLVTNNNVAYRSKDSGGTLRDLMVIDSADNILQSLNVAGAIREGAHIETYTVNVGTLGASAQSAQQTMTFRRAFASTGYIVLTGSASTEGNGTSCYARVLNTGSLTFYVQNTYAGGSQTNCTGWVLVIGV